MEKFRSLLNFLISVVGGIAAYVGISVLTLWVYSFSDEGLGLVGLLVVPAVVSYIVGYIIGCIARSSNVYFFSCMGVVMYIVSCIVFRFANYQDGEWVLLVFQFISFLSMLFFSINRPHKE
jgi:hypothetical protein